MVVLAVPDPSLIVLIGAAGSGKSTLAARHFDVGEVLSSDALRAAISGDPADQRASGAAFAALHRALERRLADRRMTVIDATNLTSRARSALLRRAQASAVPAVAMVLDLDADVVLARNAGRSGRVVPEAAVRGHLHQVRELVDDAVLEREPFERILVLRTPDDVAALTIRRTTGRPDGGASGRQV